MRMRAREASTFRTDVSRFWDAMNEKVERYRTSFAQQEAGLPEDRRTVFEISADEFGKHKAFHYKNDAVECWWSCLISSLDETRLRAVFSQTIRFRWKRFILLALTGVRPRNELNSLIMELHAELDGRLRTGFSRSMF